MKNLLKRPISILLIGALIVVIGAFIKIEKFSPTLATILLIAGMIVEAIGLILLVWHLVAKKKL